MYNHILFTQTRGKKNLGNHYRPAGLNTCLFRVVMAQITGSRPRAG